MRMIVISPTAQWLKAAFSDCSSSVIASSPYVGAYFSDAILKLPKNVSITLLTRTLIADFASSASDLEAICTIARRTAGVLSLGSLHAKVYVIDRRKALVTSANATFSGMNRNRECGLEIRSEEEIEALIEHIHSGFGAAPSPKLWTFKELEELREPVSILRAALPKKEKRPFRVDEMPFRVELSRRQLDALIKSFSGWTRLTLEGVTAIKSDVFTMDEVFVICAPMAEVRFPQNQHVREKLRQQMQRLRDLGLISFLGKGRYERLTSSI
jgi:hypothetical protein